MTIFKEMPIGSVFDVRNGATPASGEERFWDGDIAWVTPADLGTLGSRTISRGRRYITAEGLQSCAASLVPPGSLILSIRAPVGHVAIAETAVTFNQGCKGLIPRRIIDSDFAYWALNAYRRNLEVAAQGTTFAELSTARLRGERLPVPDLPTQQAIAAFLDRETARIDQLIAKKERLSALLAERRTNLISQHVSSGLNPADPVKETGLEWVPRIPNHWSIHPLPLLIWYQEGPGIMAADFRKDGVPLLRIRNLVRDTVQLAGCNFLDPDDVRQRWSHFQVDEGDLLISASATTSGKAVVVPNEAVGAIPYTGIIRIKERLHGFIRDFTKMFLLSNQFATQVDIMKAGSTIQHFGPSHLAQMKAPLPPREEQQAIVDILASGLAQVDRLVNRNQESVLLLSELRSALITAAVTGQIDVATWGKRGETDRRLDVIERELAGVAG